MYSFSAITLLLQTHWLEGLKTWCLGSLTQHMEIIFSILINSLGLSLSHEAVCMPFDRPSVVLCRDCTIPEWSWLVRVQLDHVL